MNAYQDFLDFFSMCNRTRLDGLDESYFAPMTPDERRKAFEFLLERVESGGSEESVHGLFIANAKDAAGPVRRLLTEGMLNPGAQVAAAFHLYQAAPDGELIDLFVCLMASPEAKIRRSAACYVPAIPDERVKSRLKAMVCTETDELTLLHSINKLLGCYDIDTVAVEEELFNRLYLGLRNADLQQKKSTFKELEKHYGPGCLRSIACSRLA